MALLKFQALNAKSNKSLFDLSFFFFIKISILFFNLLNLIFIYFWSRWVSVAAC